MSTKNVNTTECDQHVVQTTYDPTKSFRPYYGVFLPQGNLNFSDTGAYLIRISLRLNTTGPPSNYSIMMMAFDSGKFLIKSVANKSLLLLCFSALVMIINNN